MLKIRRERLILTVRTAKKGLEVALCPTCDGPALKISQKRAGKAPDEQ